jgi:DNA-binding transcriptional LysR family regulator
VRAFSAAPPDLAVEVQRLEWDDQEQAVLSGRVDVAYVRRPIDGRGLKLVPLYRERRLAALRSDHPLAAREALTEAEPDEVLLAHEEARRSKRIADFIDAARAAAAADPDVDGSL